MPLPLTKTGHEILNPVGPGGAPRSPELDELRLWADEMEALLEALGFAGPVSSDDEYLVRFNGTAGNTVEQAPVASTTAEPIRAERSGGAVGLVGRRTDTHGDNVTLAQFIGRGKSDAATDRDYAAILAQAVSDADGAEAGRLRLQSMQAGALADRMLIDLGLYSPSVTGGDKGAGAINVAQLYQSGVPVWRTAMKLTDETVQSNTTLFTDAELVFAMLANTKYTFRARIHFTTGATGDFKFRHTGPASPTLVQIKRAHIIGAGSAYAGIALDTAYSASDVAVAGAAGSGWIELDGLIHNGANAGSFGFRWAQNASEAVNTTVRAGSYIDWMPL